MQGRCELALGNPSAATDAFCDALRLDPAWRPDATFDEEEVGAFERTAATCTTDRGLVIRPGADGKSYLPGPMSRGKPWYKKPKYVGAIAGVVAVAAVFAFSGGGEDAAAPRLSSYPDPPPSN